VSQGLFGVGDLVGVGGSVQVNGLDLRVKPHEDRFHAIGHRVAGVINVVEVLAKRPTQKYSQRFDTCKLILS